MTTPAAAASARATPVRANPESASMNTVPASPPATVSAHLTCAAVLSPTPPAAAVSACSTRATVSAHAAIATAVDSARTMPASTRATPTDNVSAHVMRIAISPPAMRIAVSSPATRITVSPARSSPTPVAVISARASPAPMVIASVRDGSRTRPRPAPRLALHLRLHLAPQLVLHLGSHLVLEHRRPLVYVLPNQLRQLQPLLLHLDVTTSMPVTPIATVGVPQQQLPLSMRPLVSPSDRFPDPHLSLHQLSVFALIIYVIISHRRGTQPKKEDPSDWQYFRNRMTGSVYAELQVGMDAMGDKDCLDPFVD
ncbi:hypothetical protein C8R45DRAFT_1114914 [Mycena sanguinolenta]|nr:hypothetical protein C8R45DRAFT_1114914 [Mycena sanguinolenta]